LAARLDARAQPTILGQAPSIVTRLLREPLLHFLLLGAGLFLLFDLAGGPRERAPEQVVIGASDVSRLAEGFARTWQRPPTSEELAGLVHDQVDEEILYREALALGLERDDTIVRRRLRQKMEFLFDAEAPLAEPSDEEIDRHRLAHRRRFEEPPRVSFRHVYVSVDRRGDTARSDAERLLARLRGSDEGWEQSGDALSLASSFSDLEPADLSSLFGGDFATAVLALPVGAWQGPIASGYGLHLVFVRERSPARLPPLAEVRETVLRDLEATRRAEASERRLAELRERYEVRIEWPEAGG
jgi:hypothetical protein